MAGKQNSINIAAIFGGAAQDIAPPSTFNASDLVCHSVQSTELHLQDPLVSLQNAGTRLMQGIDRNSLLARMRRTGRDLRLTPSHYRDDKEIVLAAVSSHGGRYPAQRRHYLCDFQYSTCYTMLLSLYDCPMIVVDALMFASERLRSDREVVTEACISSGTALSFASNDALRADRAVVMAAVTNRGEALMFASAELRSDRGIVLNAVKQNPLALEDAADDLKADFSLVQKAVEIEGCCLRFASTELRRNRVIAIAAVSQNGHALRWVSNSLKGDKLVVQKAVSNAGSALQEASSNLRNDPTIVMAAVRNDGLALCHASNEVKECRSIVIEAVKQNGEALMYASEGLRDDRDVVLIAAGTSGHSGLCWASARLGGRIVSHRIHDSPVYDDNQVLAILLGRQMPQQDVPAANDELVVDFIKEQLQCHDIYVGLILSACSFTKSSPDISKQKIMHGPVSSKPCFLPILSHFDEATGTFLRRSIADFIGVPYGSNLAILRRAQKKLLMT